jgi:hypothetical protein
MVAGNIKMEIEVQCGIDSLIQVIKEYINKDIEIIRICRTAVLLNESGITFDRDLFNRLASKCIKLQRKDGGWTDVEETMWCIAFLNQAENFCEKVENACKWLRKQECKNGGWGRSSRDFARIPLSALILYFLPWLSSTINLKWLENSWTKDLNSENCLTYKAAFTLMAFTKNNYQPEKEELITKTIHWLAKEQNNDGGWGPWKNHPVGSDPWCTGISFFSLLPYSNEIKDNTLHKGVEWLIENQLPNGLWPYHYIEDGSSWALCALINSNKYLKIRN